MPGRKLAHDWYDGVIPDNVVFDDTNLIDTSYSFRRFRSRAKDALGSVNLSYWRSAVEGGTSIPDESRWHGRGMDIGGTLNSGRVSVSGNLTWYTADNLATWNNTAESNVNGSLFLTWSRAAWPKLSAGVTNYAYQAAFLDYGGLEANSLTRYELAVDSSPLLSAWADPEAQLKFIASYQGNSARSQWAQTADTGASDVFLGLKFTRSLLP